MVSGTESTDRIDGNIDSKPEVPSLPPSIMPSEKRIIPSSSTSQAKTVIKELYLESVYKKDLAHEFYCVNCNSCIQKVIILGDEEGSRPAPRPAPFDTFRCSSSFSFLIQIGNWFFFQSVPTNEDTHEKGDILNATLSSELRGPEAVTSPGTVILVDSTKRTTGSEQRGAKILEIVKSIIYGGLIGSVTSLTVVKYAARSGAATSSIIALSLANLIGGIFTSANNLWDLKSEQPREASSLTNEQVDRYQELLGWRENFWLHATIALLSFLVFGLVPPAVYGFTVMETDDKNLKVAAVAVASLLCITILAIGKAYIQKPPKNKFKIVLRYLAIGIMVSVVSNVIGHYAKKIN